MFFVWFRRTLTEPLQDILVTRTGCNFFRVVMLQEGFCVGLSLWNFSFYVKNYWKSRLAWIFLEGTVNVSPYKSRHKYVTDSEISYSFLLQAAETGSGKTGVSRAALHLKSNFKHLLFSKHTHQVEVCRTSSVCYKYFFPIDHQAFSIPVIQIVYETLKDQQEGKKGRAAVKTGGASEIYLFIYLSIR